MGRREGRLGGGEEVERKLGGAGDNTGAGGRANGEEGREGPRGSSGFFIWLSFTFFVYDALCNIHFKR